MVAAVSEVFPVNIIDPCALCECGVLYLLEVFTLCPGPCCGRSLQSMAPADPCVCAADPVRLAALRPPAT